ncbi:MAG TPA: hypothetical protein VNO25_06535 [Streptosporangiaceae bacterium]|nr:hypothetical protein [Streptosporangiaceae bacterium]
MNGTEGQMTHPESGVLAEFRAGLVTGRRRASIASHLEACDRCAGLSDHLGEIPVLLAAAPAPAMPDDVARRLDLVLAAEAAKRDSSERAVDDSPAHRPATPGPRRRWDFRLVTQRILVPAAAVVVLAAGGFGLSRVIGSSPSSSAAAGSEAAPATGQPANGPAAAPSEATSRSGAHPAIESPLNFPVVNSGTNYLRATLARQLETELQRQARSAAGPQVLASGSLKGCVQRVTQGTRPGTLALVERARFQGQPAIVIVAVSGGHDAAWVTAPGCSASSAHVLATATLPGTSAS